MLSHLALVQAPPLDETVWKQMQQITEEIINYKEASSGERYADVFWELPSRKDYPAYYIAIPKPMSTKQLQVHSSSF